MTEFKIRGTLNATKGAKIKGTNYILVSAAGTDTENAAELQAAYTAATNMNPDSTNIITIVASPGYYNFNAAGFEMNSEYINLVSLDGNRSIIFNGSYTVRVQANNVYVNGVDTLLSPFRIESELGNTTIENCKGGNYSFGYNEGGSSTVSGKFIDCEGGDYSFGSSFDKGTYGIASGIFTRCTAGTFSFGSGEGDAGNLASGVFTDCAAGDYSFGYGSPSGTASGTFIRCTAGTWSFGYTDASGLFMYCQGGQESFGRNLGNGGTITGKLYYCRKTDGPFTEVEYPGITRLCIDGYNSENNQG